MPNVCRRNHGLLLYLIASHSTEKQGTERCTWWTRKGLMARDHRFLTDVFELAARSAAVVQFLPNWNTGLVAMESIFACSIAGSLFEAVTVQGRRL
jgi:hypothetical protein